MGFSYLGSQMNVDGDCEAAVTVRAKFSWMKFRDSTELFYGKGCHLKVKCFTPK